MHNLIDRFLREEDGQDLVEYALVVGIVALGAILGIQGVAQQTSTMWSKVSSKVTSASSGM